MEIVDSHCHLDMLTDYDEMDNIIERANKAGIKYLQTICTRLDSFDNILNIAEKYENVFASIGVHPSEVKAADNIVSSEELIHFSNHRKVIGLGETGLDYYYNKDNQQLKKQRQSFVAHIEAAQRNSLPVIIHTRDAENDTEDILKNHLREAPFPGLIHCFSSNIDFAKMMLDLGMYISISGIVTFKNATALQEAAKYIPLDRMLIETDSPYLAPVPLRGKTNEPSYTKYVAEFIAGLKGISTEKLARQTTDNFFKLFSKAQR